MDSSELEKITNSIQEKLGDEVGATISDDIANLITLNNQVIKSINDKDTEITNLKQRNESLVTANGNLLQKIPVGFNNLTNENSKNNEDSKSKPFSFRDCFDEKGNFKK